MILTITSSVIAEDEIHAVWALTEKSSTWKAKPFFKKGNNYIYASLALTSKYHYYKMQLLESSLSPTMPFLLLQLLVAFLPVVHAVPGIGIRQINCQENCAAECGGCQNGTYFCTSFSVTYGPLPVSCSFLSRILALLFSEGYTWKNSWCENSVMSHALVK
jgi:hypothetical protein